MGRNRGRRNLARGEAAPHMHIRNDEDFVLRTRLPESPMSLRGVKCTQNTVNRNVFSFFLLCLGVPRLPFFVLYLKKENRFPYRETTQLISVVFYPKKEIQKNKRNAKCAQYFCKNINKTPDNVAGMSSRSGASSWMSWILEICRQM